MTVLRAFLLISITAYFHSCEHSEQKNGEFLEAAPEIKDDLFASATLSPASGSSASGEVKFYRLDNDGLFVKAKVQGVERAGLHGFHIHEFGDCSAKDASSAGGHFNPTNTKHGKPNTEEAHVGDLGNIHVDKNGTGTLRLDRKPVTYDNTTFKDWQRIVGKAVILHAGRDDLTSQPSGDAGKRIACGVIKTAGAR